MSLIISIEGNIGAGKSTLINYLKNKLKNDNKYIFLEEPVDDWESIQDNNINIIEKFYENVEKYSFPFQMMAYISRLSNLRNIIKKYPESIIITERSLFTDKYVFAKMLFDSNKMNIYEYKIYNKWFSEFINDLPPYKFIKIISDPLKSYLRIKKRNRNGESNITLDYLQMCDNYHEQMFIHNINKHLEINIEEYDIDSEKYIELENKIIEFIKKN